MEVALREIVENRPDANTSSFGQKNFCEWLGFRLKRVLKDLGSRFVLGRAPQVPSWNNSWNSRKSQS